MPCTLRRGGKLQRTRPKLSQEGEDRMDLMDRTTPVTQVDQEVQEMGKSNCTVVVKLLFQSWMKAELSLTDSFSQ